MLREWRYYPRPRNDISMTLILKKWRKSGAAAASFAPHLLEDIRAAFQASTDLPNLLLDSPVAHKLIAHQEGLRQMVTPVRRTGRNGAWINGLTGLFRLLIGAPGCPLILFKPSGIILARTLISVSTNPAYFTRNGKNMKP